MHERMDIRHTFNAEQKKPDTEVDTTWFHYTKSNNPKKLIQAIRDTSGYPLVGG